MDSIKKRGHRYPWRQWFARTKVVLVAGQDFHVSVSAMVVNVRCTACRLRKSVSVEVEGDTVTVTVHGRSKRGKGKSKGVAASVAGD